MQRVARRYAPPIIRGTGAARLREGLRGARRQWHLKDVQRVSNRGVIADDRPEFDNPLLAEPRDRLAKGGLGKALGIDQLGNGAVDEDLKPGLPLAEKLGQIFTALAGGVAARLDVEIRGEIAARDVRVLQLAALKGVFAHIVEDTVTYVNAPLLAAERGMEVSLVTEAESPDWRNLVTLRGTLPGGQVVSVSGTLTGKAQIEKLVEVNGFDMEIALAEHLVFLTYTDRPGIVGVVGQILGGEGINIAGMQVSRDTRGGHALIALTVDSAIPPVVLDDITATIGAVVGRTVDLDLI